jgi:hypothetical protein
MPCPLEWTPGLKGLRNGNHPWVYGEKKNKKFRIEPVKCITRGGGEVLDTPMGILVLIRLIFTYCVPWYKQEVSSIPVEDE